MQVICRVLAKSDIKPLTHVKVLARIHGEKGDFSIRFGVSAIKPHGRSWCDDGFLRADGADCLGCGFRLEVDHPLWRG